MGKKDEARKVDTLARTIKLCDWDSSPNVHTLLKIACTVLVTSYECERSGSVLKRLNTYLRASIKQERRSGLALLHIHQERQLDLEEIIDAFASKKQRRLEFVNICS